METAADVVNVVNEMAILKIYYTEMGRLPIFFVNLQD